MRSSTLNMRCFACTLVPSAAPLPVGVTTAALVCVDDAVVSGADAALESDIEIEAF